MNNMKNFIKKNWHFIFVSYYLLCVLMYSITLQKEPVLIIHAKLDDYIPFLEIFVIPYVMWYVYLFGSILLFGVKSRKTFFRFCLYAFTGMTFSYIVFFIWPNGIDFIPDLSELGRDNIFIWLTGVIHGSDLPRNVCPSLHCYSSIVIAIVTAKSRIFSKKIVIGSWVLSVSICLSTLFIKQHSVWDLFFAIVLAALLYPFTYCVKWKFAK